LRTKMDVLVMGNWYIERKMWLSLCSRYPL
jgi:hypothetical protein